MTERSSKTRSTKPCLPEVKHFWIILLLFGVTSARGLEVDVRLKWFATGSALPNHDIQRQFDDSPVYDMNTDMRLMFRHDAGSVTLLMDHSTTVISGDSLAFANAPGNTLDQTPTEDARRIMDLTWNIEDGNRHRSFHRLDRLAVQYRQGGWGVTLGRQAISWGNGFVFQPMDLFNPFAPTTVDRDYKAGDDLLLIERLFPDGSDLQVLAVGRRDAEEQITGRAGSLAAKWHTFVGEGELELLVARHISDEVYGVGLRFPLGGALMRSDVIATRLRDGGWEVSGIVNLDYSFALGEHATYLFGEYFHNGFGVDRLPVNPALLPMELTDRLGRGELFNLMKDYFALGGNIQWHPLWTQSFALINNLHDGSSLLQTTVNYEQGDHQRLQFGVVVPFGRAGDEFGGVPLLREQVTAGGATRGYLRWVYYF